MIATVDEQQTAGTSIELFARDGFYLARGLLSPVEVGAVRDAFMTQNANGPVEGLSEQRYPEADETDAKRDPLKFYARMMNPHLHPDKPVGPIARRYLLDVRFERILTQLMGEPALGVQTMFYFKPPGARGQDLHQDNFFLRVKPGTCMAAWIALDRCDSENGAMSCVPQTGRLEIACPEPADQALSFTTEHVSPPPGLTPQMIAMEPGDVLFFNGSTIHGSGPNRSADRFRRSLICHYVPASTRELSDWYHAIGFDGRDHPIATNSDGGPCGTTGAPTSRH